jgi:hypothetical protein
LLSVYNASHKIRFATVLVGARCYSRKVAGSIPEKWHWNFSLT